VASTEADGATRLAGTTDPVDVDLNDAVALLPAKISAPALCGATGAAA